MTASHLLHLDLSLGLTASALKKALLNLGAHEEKATPISKALLQKIKKQLEEVGYPLQDSETEQLNQLCLLLNNLNPQALTATRIPLSFEPGNPERSVLLALSQDLPVYESEWPGPTSDILGLVWVKTCAARFGARGESKLIKLGLSAKPEIRALWCELPALTTQSFPHSSADPLVSPLFSIQALISQPNMLPEITHRLQQMGCKKNWTHQVLEQNNQPRTHISVLARPDIYPQIIEILLILGQATEIYLQPIEEHALQKRITSTTFGSLQKQLNCRVVEFFWGSRTLRADPLAEDLESIAKATGQPQEIIRADVLSAWKKKT